MISVETALDLVLQNERNFGTEAVLLGDSVGRVLARDVFADRDFPPYNRVMMDGIAINMLAFAQGIRSFKIEKVQPAGSPQLKLEAVENCIEIMTGAVLPDNTDAIIPYEQCDISDGLATVKSTQAIAMQHVHVKGVDGKKDELLLQKPERITPAMVGVLASVGLSEVEVLRLPAVTICSTGDELVDVTENPEAHQVRRSNVYMLAGALRTEGILARTLHLPDDPAIMTAEISRLVNSNDAVLFSGAVSKGKFDYLPGILEQLGMQLVFHTIAQRPGKPFLFGKFSNCLVFGFPGNPVSTFVCYHKYFKAWLRRSMLHQPLQHFATLATDVNFKPSLSYHMLVQVANEAGTLAATPVEGSSSGDLVTLAKVNGMITLPADRDNFNEGEVFELDLF
jgi:molybdopterin molybdotransferase